MKYAELLKKINDIYIYNLVTDVCKARNYSIITLKNCISNINIYDSSDEIESIFGSVFDVFLNIEQEQSIDMEQNVLNNNKYYEQDINIESDKKQSDK